MTKRQSYLSQSDISQIKRDIANLFSEETISSLSFVKGLKTRINNILKQYTKNNKGKMEIDSLNYTTQKFLGKGYVLIQEFRQLLLGEVLSYRYYQNVDGQISITDFQEDDILHYMKFTTGKIYINQNLHLKQHEANQEYIEKVNRVFPKITKEMTRQKSGYYVNQNAINRYKANPKLLGILYNEGHIFEAIDLAYSDLAKHDRLGTKGEDTIVKNYVFQKYLMRDTVRGSKGGDNPFENRSIKANSAGLYSFNSIYEDLVNISLMLELRSKAEIAQIIKSTFLDISKFNNNIEQMDKAAEMAAEKLMSILQIK